MKTLSPEVVARYRKHVDRRGPDECWPWKLKPAQDGYGRIQFDGRSHRSHRIGFFIVFGYEADLVCHACDNPMCHNPKHWFNGTPHTNMLDKVKKGRLRCGVGEKNGQAKLTKSVVIEMRQLRSEGWMLRSIAQKFGVTAACVQDAMVGGRNWQHI